MLNWMILAKCRGADREQFFPVGLDSTAKEQMSESTAAQVEHVKRTYCGRCFVKTECLDYALAQRSHDGIFGGTTPQERRKIRQRNIRHAKPASA